ncbi:MAG: hypothetical protein WAK89_16920 [Candidatus Sulfotelmatobacter sp.]
MQSSKPHFEQIPVEVVKKITEEFHDDVAGSHSATTGTSPSRSRPQRSASLGRQPKARLTAALPGPGINCSICGKPVAVETAKTDEAGQAAHDDCYLLKLGINAGPSSVHASKQAQRPGTS